MSFVKLSIFGTSFEVCPCVPNPRCPPDSHRFPRSLRAMLICNQLEWVRSSYRSISALSLTNRCQGPSASSGTSLPHSLPTHRSRVSSSAKDQLTGTSVAIKKIMKPFSTPVLSKRTYRELKLLKHIQHENVRSPAALLFASHGTYTGLSRLSV